MEPSWSSAAYTIHDSSSPPLTAPSVGMSGIEILVLIGVGLLTLAFIRRRNTSRTPVPPTSSSTDSLEPETSTR